MARLMERTKTRELSIRELLFTDDAAIVAHIIDYTTEQFEQAATLFGHTISIKKTVSLYQPPPGQISIDPHVEMYVTPLKSHT